MDFGGTQNVGIEVENVSRGEMLNEEYEEACRMYRRSVEATRREWREGHQQITVERVDTVKVEDVEANLSRYSYSPSRVS